MTETANAEHVSPTLGVRLPNSGPFASAEEIYRTAALAEELGYDTVWVHDHISWPKEKLTHFATGSLEACTDQDSNFFESITTLAAVGGRLSRINLGVVGLVLPLRDPRLLAKQVATVSRLTGSRLILAVAIGNIPDDFDAVGVPFRKRGKIANDHLGALRAILDGEQPVTYGSDFVSFSGTFYPRPADMPIWVTGGSEAGLTRAAKYGDGWMTVYCTTDRYQSLVTRLAELAEEHGRTPESLAHGYETYVCVGRTRQEAEDISRTSVVEKFGDMERASAVCIIGDASECSDRIAEYAAVGAGHLELKFICHDTTQLAEMMERTAARLLV